jgi:hypothetical protein
VIGLHHDVQHPARTTRPRAPHLPLFPRPGRLSRRGGGVQGGRSPSRSDAKGALDADGVAWTLGVRGSRTPRSLSLRHPLLDDLLPEASGRVFILGGRALRGPLVYGSSRASGLTQTLNTRDVSDQAKGSSWLAGAARGGSRRAGRRPVRDARGSPAAGRGSGGPPRRTRGTQGRRG